MIELFLANYKLVLGLIVLVIVIGFGVFKFITQPTSKQKEQLRVVLLELVLLAEKVYGSSTGKVKLSFVYSELVVKFPYLRYVPFSVIEKLIDETLEEMRHLLETNPKVAELIKDNSK